ncbi:RND family efflux transporter, MFP subunit [Sinomicrobium oceani]|uniref:RND family efflux transporter, MFP subunit n=2 Tax=Sinomicrobium oceani TaxID=1150368 RepID=A0A1K1RAN9_9FLAO|nr:RND family efflux transporter, MFP subunit [Sinomicrobium oceani]
MQYPYHKISRFFFIRYTMKRTHHSFLITLCLMLILQACGHGDTDKNNGKETTSADGPEAFLLSPDSLSSTIRIPGELRAYQEVDLYAKVNSFIKTLKVDIGNEVKTGQLLAVLEAPEINSQLAAAESRLKSREAVYISSKATYNRLLETSKTPGTVSRNDLDIAFAQQESDLAQLEAARANHREIIVNRDYLQIKAPFDGVITARNVSPGAYVGPSGRGSEQPIFTLHEQKNLRLVVNVPEGYISYLSPQSTISFTVKSLPNLHFEAKVSRLAGALDNRLRSQRSEMDVENHGNLLLPGMVAEVSIPVKSRPGSFVVPSSAVLNSTEGMYVVKLTDGKIIWVPVAVGGNGNGKTEVFGELHQKDTLILRASEEFRNQADVEGYPVIK